jgi:hypothetical protein
MSGAAYWFISGELGVILEVELIAVLIRRGATRRELFTMPYACAVVIASLGPLALAWALISWASFMGDRT